MIQLWWILEKLCKRHCCLISLPLVFLFIILSSMRVHLKVSCVCETINSHLKGVCQILKHSFQSFTYLGCSLCRSFSLKSFMTLVYFSTLQSELAFWLEAHGCIWLQSSFDLMAVIIIFCKVAKIMGFQIFLLSDSNPQYYGKALLEKCRNLWFLIEHCVCDKATHHWQKEGIKHMLPHLSDCFAKIFP